MILEKQKESLVLESDVNQASIKMSLDMDSAQILMNMLSKNLYSDEIGSTIRETASNALDSHRRANVTDPIIVGFRKQNDGNYQFSVEDFGIGLDDKDVEQIISKYGKSTKRNSANELGMMGLGFKAPLAYSSSFYFICRKDGIERKYMMYEGEDGNTIDFLYEKEVDARNGVKIIVPVKYGDRYSFIQKIKEQLAYFESVYFDCEDVKNDFKIIRGDDFQVSEMFTGSVMHICLDNVYYPIDFQTLEISSIYFPVGLRFSLSDGLFPTPNRESIRYTKEGKDAIKAKIEKVADYFVTKYNDTIKETDNIFDIFKYFDTGTRQLTHPIAGKGELNISLIGQFSNIPFLAPKLKGVKLLDLKRINTVKDHLLQEYVPNYNLRNGRFVNTSSNPYNKNLKLHNVQTQNIYIYDGKLTPLKKIYLKEDKGVFKRINNNKHYSIMVKKANYIDLGTGKPIGTSLDCFAGLLQLTDYPEDQWDEMIKEAKYIISLITKDFIDLGTITIPNIWLENRKAARLAANPKVINTPKQRKLLGEIKVKESSHLERYVNGKNCKFVSETYSLADLHKKPNIFVYSTQDSEETLQKLYLALKNTKLVILSNREYETAKKINVHNWIDLNNFMQGKHIIFKRAITAAKIKKLTLKYSSIFSEESAISEISISLKEKIDILNKYLDKYYTEASLNLLESMTSLITEKHSFDTHVYDIYKKVEEELEKVPFLNIILSNIGSSYYTKVKPGTIEAFRDLCKYHKYRIDWQHYKLTINKNKIEEKND